MKFEIIQNQDNGKFYFHLKAKNGQIILSSQGYTGKPACKKGIESVRTNGTDESNFEVKESNDGKHFFNLIAANKQVVGTSQMYKGMDGLKKGIQSVMTNAPDATVEDLTAAS